MKYLAAQQRPDGTFSLPAPARGVRGVTLLCALALRHAGTPASVAPVEKAVAHLFPAAGTAADDLPGDVYGASIALMLLHAIGRDQPEAPLLAARLARGLDAGTGWWGYGTPKGAVTTPYHDGTPNLSTAQFACLGLWAARRMGIEVAPSVWQTHAEALLTTQSARGSWPYGPKGTRGSWERSTPGRDGYFTGTCMGVANLLLAREALKGIPDVQPEFSARIEAAIQRALDSMGADGMTRLRDPRGGEMYFDGGAVVQNKTVPFSVLSPGFGPYYTLYALEKACLFADWEALKSKAKAGKVAWYASMATWLLSMQDADGGWAPALPKGEPEQPTNVVDSALALLILVRSPQTAHPTTPRDVDARPRGPVTPGEGADPR